MIIKIKKFYKLARLDKPIGIYLLLWPSLLGLLLGGVHAVSIDIMNYLIVIIGSILVRSCGCVINDISDFLSVNHNNISNDEYRIKLFNIFLSDNRKLYCGIVLIFLSLILYFVDGIST